VERTYFEEVFEFPRVAAAIQKELRRADSLGRNQKAEEGDTIWTISQGGLLVEDLQSNDGRESDILKLALISDS
jgi:hypothetical protein